MIGKVNSEALLRRGASFLNCSMKVLRIFIVATLLLIAVSAAGFRRIPALPGEFRLQANSPQFWDLVDHNARLSVVSTGFGFTEGPVWDHAGFLYVSDETLNKIFRVYPNGKKDEVISLGDPDGSTFDRQHRLIDCASVLRAIIAVTPEGKYQVLANHYEGKKFNSPNDVIVGPDGALYFTDPTLDLVAGRKN